MLCNLLWKGCVLTMLSCTFASAWPQSQSPEDGLSGADQGERGRCTTAYVWRVER